MNDFKEWLSDYLRYFLLAFIIILIISAAVLGISIYSKVVNGSEKSGRETETVSEKDSMSESAKETEPLTVNGTEKESEKVTEAQTEKETEAQTEPETEPETDVQTEIQTEPPTEPVPETEPQPVYLTMQGSCYLRAEPSMEAEIIGEYWAGTTVEFLEDAGGWYKVRVDGMTGYMGARFF